MDNSKVINNIIKLLDTWGLTINDLARETGISLTGIKKMMDSGSFKLENLEKIASALKISMLVLISDNIVIREKMEISDTDGVKNILKILWTGGDEYKVTSLKSGKKIGVSTEYYSQYREKLDGELIVDGDFSELNNYKRLYKDISNKFKDLENENISLRTQINDKNQIVEFIKRENLFAYSNIIQLLMQNRQQSDGSISPDQLNDLTRSKIFDKGFLKSLLDAGLISENDYSMFTESIKSKS